MFKAAAELLVLMMLGPLLPHSVFDVRVCQFENDQWRNAYGPETDNSEIEYDIRRKAAREGLNTIARWNRR